ncbi:MAG: hypothetical protein RJA57_1599, partial [Bacteroidota bacterium]
MPGNEHPVANTAPHVFITGTIENE